MVFELSKNPGIERPSEGFFASFFSTMASGGAPVSNSPSLLEDDVLKSIVKVYPAVEVIQSCVRIDQLCLGQGTAANLYGLIGENLGFDRLVLGQGISVAEMNPSGRCQLRIGPSGDSEVGEQFLTGDDVGSHIAVLKSFLEARLAEGATIRPGDLIAVSSPNSILCWTRKLDRSWGRNQTASADILSETASSIPSMSWPSLFEASLSSPAALAPATLLVTPPASQ